MLGGCDDLKRTDFLQFSIYRGCGGNDRTDYLLQFCIWEAMVVLTEPIFHNFNARRV